MRSNIAVALGALTSREDSAVKCDSRASTGITIPEHIKFTAQTARFPNKRAHGKYIAENAAYKLSMTAFLIRLINY